MLFRAGIVHCGSLAGPLTPHLSDSYLVVAWLGLATSWRRTSERILSVCCAACLCPCFTRFHQALGWSSCLRSPTNRHAVDHCVSLDDHGHWDVLILSRVYGAPVLPSRTILDWEFGHYWCFSATGSPRLLSGHRKSSLLVYTLSCPPFLPCTAYDPPAVYLVPCLVSRDNEFDQFVCLQFWPKWCYLLLLLQFVYVQFRISLGWLTGDPPRTFVAPKQLASKKNLSWGALRNPNHRAPNHQLTIGWNLKKKFPMKLWNPKLSGAILPPTPMIIASMLLGPKKPKVTES